MKRLLLLSVGLLFLSFSYAQLLTWTPEFPTASDAAQSYVITMDATKGNRGLMDYSPTNDVYVHIGVITNYSTSATDWKYVKFPWGSTSTEAQCVFAGSNKWRYTITGTLRSFFGITDPNETILKIAILFRNGSGSRVQRNSDNSDMYTPIYSGSLATRVNLPPSEPFYYPRPEPQSWTIGSNFNIQGVSNGGTQLDILHNGTLVSSVIGNNTVNGSSTVTAYGNQQIVSRVSLGPAGAYDTLNIFVPPPAPPTSILPGGLRDGINYEPGDTSVTLVLYAPGKNFATVIGDFNGWIQDLPYVMNKTPDGTRFWLRVKGLQSGVEYAFQYVVDDTIRIGDPYTQKVLDPYNDGFITSATYPALKPYPTGKTSGIVSVLQTAAPAYNWGITNFQRPDKRRLMIYEMLVRDFVANHDWKTVRDTLGYLKRMGVNAIEIMPFNEFEGNLSWGYNPDFYFSVDKYYGPANDLKRFIDSCHANGIAVIMDIALNHSFGLSPMVQLYWDRNNNRPATNNPWFNPAAMHPFNVGFDMNHESLATRYFTSRVVEHWLTEFKIDGFRFDLSKGFTQVQSCDVNGNNCNQANWDAYDASRIAIWKRYYDTVQLKSPGSYVILEHFAANTEERELSDYGMLLWGNSNYNFGEATRGQIQNSNFDYGIFKVRGWTKPHLITYMESHDEERLMFKNIREGLSSGTYDIKDTTTGLKRVEMSAAFLLSIPGPKMMWQFGETGYDYSINSCHPGNTIPLPYPSNGQCRLDAKPIRWDYMQQVRRKRLYDIYTSLFKLRDHPAYREAFMSDRIDQNLGGAVKWLKVTTDSSNLLIVGNFDIVPQTTMITFPHSGTWYDYLDAGTITALGTPQSITLQPGEYHLYLNRNIVNAVVTPVQDIDDPVNTLIVSIHPNPVTTTGVLDLNIPESGSVTIEVWTSSGQLIKNEKFPFLIKGNHQVSLMNAGERFSAGTYMIRVKTKNHLRTVKFILQ